MTKPARTPGPWRVLSPHTDRVYGETDDDGIVAQGMSTADACLVAAAPELLDALLRLYDEHTDCASCDLCEPARAAILKATGRQP